MMPKITQVGTKMWFGPELSQCRACSHNQICLRPHYPVCYPQEKQAHSLYSECVGQILQIGLFDTCCSHSSISSCIQRLEIQKAPLRIPCRWSSTPALGSAKQISLSDLECTGMRCRKCSKGLSCVIAGLVFGIIATEQGVAAAARFSLEHSYVVVGSFYNYLPAYNKILST